MEMGKVASAELIYEEADSIEIIGKRAVIKRYVSDGYHVTEERNGYWSLIRPAKLKVMFADAGSHKIFDVREDVLAYYDSKKITDTLVAQLKDDIDHGRISFAMNEEGTKYKMIMAQPEAGV